ncbi:MAG: undecaprenyl-diphosphate phosphatase, partial [Solirubrobacteraceae bacterium]
MPRTNELVALGLLQGPAELLPVSSSAHVGLLLGRMGVAGATRKEVEVALHAGSAVALAHRGPFRWGLLAAATVPPALAGLLLERVIESRLGTPPTIAAGLLAGGVAMVLADRT